MKRLKVKNNYYSKKQLNELIPLAGIYKLFEFVNGIIELVYVGKSKNVRYRLIEHSRNIYMKFDFFDYEFYPKRMITYIEKQLLSDYVKKYNRLPKYNRQLG